jgi:hypothetical protein
MDLTLTLALGGALALVALAAGWLGARPPDPRRGPRLVPYRLIMLLAAAGLVLMAVHALNILGFRTGR